MNHNSANKTFAQRIVRDYPQIHLSIGLVGNALFFVGSVLFLWHSLETPAIWLFIVGSFGMWMGSIGKAMVDLARHHRRKEGETESQSNSQN